MGIQHGCPLIVCLHVVMRSTSLQDQTGQSVLLNPAFLFDRLHMEIMLYKSIMSKKCHFRASDQLK